jgi:hypothetical protein
MADPIPKYSILLLFYFIKMKILVLFVIFVDIIYNNT